MKYDIRNLWPIPPEIREIAIHNYIMPRKCKVKDLFLELKKNS